MTRQNARYAGTCAVCGRSIRPGTDIDYDRATRQAVRHSSCQPYQREADDILVSQGEGYGGRPYTVGQVMHQGSRGKPPGGALRWLARPLPGRQTRHDPLGRELSDSHVHLHNRTLARMFEFVQKQRSLARMRKILKWVLIIFGVLVLCGIIGQITGLDKGTPTAIPAPVAQVVITEVATMTPVSAAARLSDQVRVLTAWAMSQPTPVPTIPIPATMSQPTPVPTIPIPATMAPPPTVPNDANGFPMDAIAVSVSDLYELPSQYNGQKVTFSCIVSTFAKDDAGDVSAANCQDPQDDSAVVQVDISGLDVTRIHERDTVRFYGVCEGAITGKNVFGGEVTETLVQGMFINDVTSGYRD